MVILGEAGTYFEIVLREHEQSLAQMEKLSLPEPSVAKLENSGIKERMNDDVLQSKS
ncbi:hypothetical protein REC12_03515 [Desulfosporosinus sp. PR]|nr:hypothetical protein [Desulfosporosinus sp. PR]